VDLAVVIFGALRFRTLVPLTERWRGYRLARRGTRRSVPAAVIDRQLNVRRALRRLAAGA